MQTPDVSHQRDKSPDGQVSLECADCAVNACLSGFFVLKKDRRGGRGVQRLQERICSEGKIVSPTILKVDSFLNHQVDPVLTMDIGREIAKRFQGESITKVLTIEASGIHFAHATAFALGVPFVYAKKRRAVTQNDDVYSASIYSYTKQTKYEVCIAKSYLTESDVVLIVDDILAQGESLIGLANMIESSRAKLVGAGIVIEKSFQPGRAKLESMGIKVHALARIASMENGKIEFLQSDSEKEVAKQSC
jgi:xanthine phosphoribosyltransferase